MHASPLRQRRDLVSRENFTSAFIDRNGLVLWCAGSPSVARTAEQSGFLLGSNWSEDAVGTNAPGTAVASGNPVTVFANEHWSSQVHDWVCYAAPVRNRFGSIIGALDISTSWRSESGLALATVTAMIGAIASGDLETASRRYQGQLLPQSESPAIVELRHHIDVSFRSALLRAGSKDQLLAFQRFHPFDTALLEAAEARQ